MKKLLGCTLCILVLLETGLQCYALEDTVPTVQEQYTASSLDGFDATTIQKICEENYVTGMVYLCDAYEVYTDIPGAASEGYSAILDDAGTKSAKGAINSSSDTWDTQMEVSSTTLLGGTCVQILDVQLSDGLLWCHVKYAYEDDTYTGYIARNYLAVTNELFLSWEKQIPTSVRLVCFAEEDENADINQFPASYQEALLALREIHPNWVFVPFRTNVDFGYAVKSEIGAKSLVPTSWGDSWKNGNYGDGWSYASEAAIKYYMDPRNFLDEKRIFQFEQLTYNASYHSVNATQNVLNGSFMAGLMPGTGYTYAQWFVQIGSELGVSPFHIASRLIQEQGRNGTSDLISGKYPGYENLYNYFNIKASGKTHEEIVVNGLTYARNKGWNSHYNSIYGGISFLAADYIQRGQDTLYLQKFDVDNSYNGMFSHQYMQNIAAPANEAKNIFAGYTKANSIENTFAFRIPVYQNMPSRACASPDTAITSVSIYMPQHDEDEKQVTAGLVVKTNYQVAIEYRWLAYDISKDVWMEVSPWTDETEWLYWTPEHTGDYLLQGEARVAGGDQTETTCIGLNYKNPDDVHIKGMCQMPYEGEGGGFLIGVETDKNPNQQLRYELMILDCTLLAEGKDAWIWTTGKNTVEEGNAFWAVWQPQYGYYWTYFKVFDEEGNLLTDACYGFENI